MRIRSASHGILHHLLFAHCGGRVVVEEPPLARATVEHVAEVVPILSEPVVDEDGMQVVGFLLATSVRSCDYFLQFGDAFFELGFLSLSLLLELMDNPEAHFDVLLWNLGQAPVDFIWRTVLNLATLERELSLLVFINHFNELVGALLNHIEARCKLRYYSFVGVTVEDYLNFLELSFHLLEVLLEARAQVSVLVQKQIHVNGLVELKLLIILHQALVLFVEVHPRQLEHHGVGRPADP
mmetsp:Transcript_31698/g.48547  ORF Transcript_31698/g.48547 Transcript_31698/m.48547 type:complete len:239 (-) Transcript_31698:1542-2258(-)|eukprot:CAMPEP_0170482986 /NCGR_PEP_ID=MMETSP0208-20121228/2759_1 /TAXON_ID=197538 /ORGANISM="Strombidium inclinatum, Strain S3" /LENGTH=238 /DNA_ID=CAMNT_0010755883 /DNA_START=1502 /DNA_END=2218 /DNA_ORIENTATION=-